MYMAQHYVSVHTYVYVHVYKVHKDQGKIHFLNLPHEFIQVCLWCKTVEFLFVLGS